MKKRPLIGVTVDCSHRPGRYELHTDYATSVEKAGGLPLAIPYRTALELIPEIVDRFDGFLMTGGDDIDPALYGQTWHSQAIKLDPARQEFELALLAEIEKRRRPMMGICLGCQIVNVYRGGSLHQFLPEVARPEPIEHRGMQRPRPTHPVEIDPDSSIGRAIGSTRIIASTYHSQAVDRVGRGLRVVSRAPDGVIEAIEDASLPLFAAVQWHPERLQEMAEHRAIFRLLVERSGEIG